MAECGADVVVAAKSERGRDLLPGSIHETAAEVEEATTWSYPRRIERYEQYLAAIEAAIDPR